MLDMFLYNWQVREDWFKWCENLSEEELLSERVGGTGSILKNLVHIIDCELIWINYMLQEPIIYPEKDSISDLENVIKYSNFTRSVTEKFFRDYNDFEKHNTTIISKNGTTFTFTFKKIILHIISHEIHHIGQLSIWSRQIGVKPVSSDLICREYS